MGIHCCCVDTVKQRIIDAPVDPPDEHVACEGNKYYYTSPPMIFHKSQTSIYLV